MNLSTSIKKYIFFYSQTDSKETLKKDMYYFLKLYLEELKNSIIYKNKRKSKG